MAVQELDGTRPVDGKTGDAVMDHLQQLCWLVTGGIAAIFLGWFALIGVILIGPAIVGGTYYSLRGLLRLMRVVR